MQITTMQMLRTRAIAILLAALSVQVHVLAQAEKIVSAPELIVQNKVLYRQSFGEIMDMLHGKRTMSLKRAVFLCENAYFNGQLDYGNYCAVIADISDRVKKMVSDKGVRGYRTCYNWAIYSYLVDSSAYNRHNPYRYDFEHFLGEEKVSNGFVTKLLSTHKGNCTSLPLLYQIVCREVGGEAYLVTVPHHLYVKHRGEDGRWVNVELTHGGFPRDQWIIESCNVTVEGIRSGAYMKPMTPQEELSFVIFNMAVAYHRQFGYDEFALQMVDSGVAHYPRLICLLMEKANCHMALADQERNKRGGRCDTAYMNRHLRMNARIRERCSELGLSPFSNEDYAALVKRVFEERDRRKRESKR